MIHEVLPVGPLQCNCSIFGDEQTGDAVVIDPGDEIGRVLRLLEKHRLKVSAIIITHAHIDHIGGAAKLKAATGAPVYMNQNDIPLYDQLGVQAQWIGVAEPEKTSIDVDVRDGSSLDAAGTRFDFLHTPGHTQGSVCVVVPAEKKLIAGDTLFRDSIGRTDLPGGDGRKILSSIREKLLTLDDSTVVVPGHGAGTTIGRERELNPFLRGLSG